MKILLTGGGTGGHFYPLIAVASEIRSIADAEKLAHVRLYYMSDNKYDAEALAENGIEFISISAGKLRKSFSPQVIIELIKAGIGVFGAIVKVFQIYPDVVFAKGGYASFPALCAARILGIPVVIHESDVVPGRVTKWAGKFAQAIAVSYAEAAQYFPKERVAHTGQPIRDGIERPSDDGAAEYLGLSREIPTLLVIGGSTGAQKINDALLGALPELLSRYQVIHQTGKANFEEVEKSSFVFLQQNENRHRYKPVPFLNVVGLKMAAGISSLVVTRAGSMLFEIALWGRPAIVIPITNSIHDHQRKNAYAFARSGVGVVIEESNLTTHVLISEIDRIMSDEVLRQTMVKSGASFGAKNAGEKIAQKIIEIARTHITS